jgi:predicted dehydrogenase
MDLGVQLLDLSLFLTGLPKVKTVRLYDYSHNPEIDVKDGALAVIETETGMTITIEVSWKMPLERDMIYTNLFGKEGAAFLNPLRINKELHGSLVNLNPLSPDMNSPQFKRSYENEIRHFIQSIRGEAENLSPAEDALTITRIVDALYQSAREKREIAITS